MTWQSLQDFFFLHRGFYIQRKTARELAHFIPIYFELLQAQGIYISDVDFSDLRSVAKQRIIFGAYNLWTKDTRDWNIGEIHLTD